MDILICFKVVPDLDMMAEYDWVINNGFQVDTGFVKTIINPYDESALELALKLQDAAKCQNIDLTLTALTIGKDHANKVLKNLLALKYHSAIRVEYNFDIRFKATLVAKIICQCNQKIKEHQVIILGNQSNEGNNAKTPLLVAEMLGIPCITSVINVKLSEQGGCLAVTSKIDELMIEQTIKPPVVLVVGEAPNSYIRVPTLRDKMQYGKKEINVYTLTDLGIEENAIEEENDSEVVALSYQRNGRSCTFIQGENAAKKAEVLYRDYLIPAMKGRVPQVKENKK